MAKRIAWVSCLVALCLILPSCQDPGGGGHPPRPCAKVEPGAGPLSGGNLVEVTSLGTCFFGANTEIKFGGKPATIIDIRSPTELVAEVPPGDHPGYVDVVIIGEDMGGNVCDCLEPDAYLYEEPGCVKVAPDAGPLAGGNHVEVTSLGICLFGPNTEVKFGGKPATIIDIRSPTELVAEVPPGDRPGYVDVILIGEDRHGNPCDCVQPDAYFYKEPACAKVRPDAGPLAGGNHVEVISGGICLFGPNTVIKFGGKPATIIDIRSPTELVAEVPPGDQPGFVDLIVIGEDAHGHPCDCVQPDAYLYREPDCVRVEPRHGPLAGGNLVEVTSLGICLFGPNTVIKFDGKPATIIDIRSPTELVAEVPPGNRPGYVDVVVIGEDAHGHPCDCVQHNAYFYKEPGCVRVEPEAGPLAGGNHVEVTSLGICLFGPNTEIKFGGKPAKIIDIRSPTELVAEVPPGDQPGFVDVVVIGEDAHGHPCDCVQPNAYFYKEPGCAKVEPGHGPLAGGNHVEVISLGTCLFGPNTEIRFGGKPATIIDIRSPTELVAEVPPGDQPGYVDVVVIGEDAHGHPCDCVQPDAYLYKELGCVRVEPDAGPLAGGNHVEVTSLGMCLFGPNTVVEFGGKPARIIDIRSSTELVAEVPAGDRPGLVDVVVIGVNKNGDPCDCVQPDAYTYVH